MTVFIDFYSIVILFKYMPCSVACILKYYIFKDAVLCNEILRCAHLLIIPVVLKFQKSCLKSVELRSISEASCYVKWAIIYSIICIYLITVQLLQIQYLSCVRLPINIFINIMVHKYIIQCQTTKKLNSMAVFSTVVLVIDQ